jgi:ATP-grasp domain-containing protein
MDLLGDRAYAPVPVTTVDADDLISAPRAAPMLDGYGDGVVADRDALAELAMRLSAVADALPEVTECTLGVTAVADGAVVTTAQVFVGPPTARPDTGPRRLRGL